MTSTSQGMLQESLVDGEACDASAGDEGAEGGVRCQVRVGRGVGMASWNPQDRRGWTLWIRP
jgi:hypothetical protein